MKKLALDTFYNEDAYTAGVIFREWNDPGPLELVSAHSPITSRYIPGQFYLRELPPIKNLIETQIGWDRLREEFDTILVDGLYDLWDNLPGLGHHLKDLLDSMGCTKIEVIGIAKSKVRDCELIAKPCIRGKFRTTNPLWINGSGNKDYVSIIQSMWGDARIPDLLKLVDNKSKNKI